MCPSNYAHSIALTAKHHDLIALALTDPHEVVFPKFGLVHLTDLESGESVLVDSSNSLFQEQFINQAKVRESLYRSLLVKMAQVSSKFARINLICRLYVNFQKSSKETAMRWVVFIHGRKAFIWSGS